MPAFKDLTFRLFGEDKSASDSLDRLSKHAESVSGRIGRGFAGLGKVVGGIGLAGAAAAAAGAAAIVATGIGEAMDASAGVAQLQAGLRSTNNAAHVTVGGMEALASSIQGMSGQTDDSIVKAQSLLLTFTNIRNSGPDKIFDQTTVAAANMAARLGGDAASQAMLLGKALNDPEKGLAKLTKVGVSFTEQQKDQVKALVKSGDTIAAQKVILGELNKEFGGSAKAAGQSLPGQLERAKRAFEDVSQTVVETILPVVTPAIEGIAGAVKRAEPFLTTMAEVVRDKLGVGLKIVGGFVGPIFAQLSGGASGSLPKVQELVQSVGAHLVGAFRKIAPAVGPVLQQLPKLLDAIIPAVAKVYLTIVDGIGQIVPPLMRVVQTVIPVVIQVFKTLYPAVSQVFKGLIAAVAPLLQLLSVILPPVFSALLQVVTPIFQTIVSIISGALRVVQGVIQTVLGVVTGNWKLAWDGLKNVFGGVIDIILGAVHGVVAPFVNAFEAMKTRAGGAITGFLKIAGGVIDWFQDLPGTVLRALAGAGKWLLDTGRDVLGGLLDGAKHGLVALGRWELGIAATVIGWLAGAARWLVDTGSDILDGLLSGARAGLTAVAKFITGLPDRFSRWTAGAARWLLAAGGHVVDGLVKGLQDKIGAVSDVVGQIARTVSDVFTGHHEIKSPSRLFARFGRWIGEGLVKGLAGSNDDVKSAMTDLAQQVTDGFTAMTEKREALLASIKKQSGQLASLLKDEPELHKAANGKVSAAQKAAHEQAEKTWRQRVATLRSGLNAERKAYSDLGFSKAGQKAAQSALTARIASDTAQLEKLATKREDLRDRLKTAQDALKTQQDAWNQTYSSTFDSAFGTGNVVGTYQAVAQEHQAAIDQIKQLREQLSGLDSSSETYGTDSSKLRAQIGDQQSIVDGTANSATRMRSTLQAQVEKTKRFQADLRQLVSMGVDPATYQQLLAGGIAGGGLEAADDLIASGAGGVGQMADLQAQLKAASNGLATDAAQQMNGVGVQAAQGLVDGLTSQLNSVQSAMDQISDALVKTLKKKLDIRSPSRVMTGHGKQIPAGLVIGINSGRGDVEASMSALVNTRNRWATAPGSTGQPGQIPAASTGERALVHIDQFIATPEQSPAEIAADLGWLARGGL